MYYDMEQIKISIATSPYDLTEEEMVEIVGWFEDSNHQTADFLVDLIHEIGINLEDEGLNKEDPMLREAFSLAADFLLARVDIDAVHAMFRLRRDC